MKYNIPTLMALYQEKDVACNWTGHVKDCKLLRPGHKQKPTTRESPRKTHVLKSSTGTRPAQSSGTTAKLHHRPTNNKRKMPPKPLVTTDAGFARFLKEHSSPKHQRVTAGGRIVPMDTGDDSKAGEKDSEERRRLSRQQHSSMHQVSPSMIKSINHPRGGNVVVPNPASRATDDQVHNGRGLLKPVPITTPQIPVKIPIPVQSFMPPVFSQQSMGIYQATGTTQQFEDGYFQTLNISPDLNFDPAGLFRSKLDQVHNIVNGLEDATLVDFKHNLRLLLDLVGRPIDSIRVEYLIYLHQQMQIALDTASRHLQSVDIEIAMRSTTSPAHVGLRIKWKRIRSEIFDRLEEIKLTLGEALDQFDGVPSVRHSITKTLFPVEMAFEPSAISPVPNIFYDNMPRLEEPFQQIENKSREYIMEPKCEVMRLFTPNAPDFVPASHAQISDARHAIDHPAPERAGRFDDNGSDLYGDGDTNGSDADPRIVEFHKEENKGLGSKSHISSNHGVGGLPITPQDLANEESSAPPSESASSEVSQDIGNEETGIQVHQASEQADGVVETRIPRFLPPNMRHRDSQTLPRSFPHRLSNTKKFAAKRRPGSRYFPWNWRSTDSGSRSDLSFSDDYDEGSQLEGCDRKMNTARKWNHSEAGPVSLPNKAGYFDLSSEGSSSQGDPCTKDADYDADIELTQEPDGETVWTISQNERVKAIRAELRAMQGIGQHELPIGRPTVKTFTTTATGLPGRFQYESGWMALALKKLIP